MTAPRGFRSARRDVRTVWIAAVWISVLPKNEGGLTGAPAEGSVKAARLSLFFLPGRMALSRT
jgi:hypothetical protein